jgi:hypothetical protein
MTLHLDDLRLVGFWAADCAQRVLGLFEARAPADARPREAIAGARAFAQGQKRTARLRVLALAAHAAAREVGDPAAAAAARAAGLAAAVAYTHPLPTLDQAKHLLGSAVYAARARELAASGTRGRSPSDACAARTRELPASGTRPRIPNDACAAAAEKEIRWAIRHASPKVRHIVQRWPRRTPGRGRLDSLYFILDAALRSPLKVQK